MQTFTLGKVISGEFQLLFPILSAVPSALTYATHRYVGFTPYATSVVLSGLSEPLATVQLTNAAKNNPPQTCGYTFGVVILY